MEKSPFTSTFLRHDTPFHREDGITVLKSSEGLGWASLYSQLTVEEPHDTVCSAVQDIWFVLQIQPVNLWRRTGGKQFQGVLAPDSMVLTGAGDASRTVIANKTEALHVFVKSATFEEVAHEMFGASGAGQEEIASVVGLEDRALSLLLRSVKQTLDDPWDVARLKADYLAHAIAAHTLRNAASWRGRPEQETKYRLGTYQLKAVTEYLEANLSASLHLDDLAAAANLGRTAFLQQFKASTGQTPHQYLMAARVRKACELLKGSAVPLSDIAYACGFADQAHFSTTFKRIVGVTPSQYRREFF
ncbi:helix-turn-helix domain-containing protein [Billgrantia endophytica]|uniref:HTH araC/xylS-type domain-containing protein n=1 Tax=Billgrantia endophytica TaxID=2033802 RepID=A0A2N7U0M6_9GAMM|nr:AraC family transcriptional regulator [Halomonas endophytica]PMR73997.1 hypothetical protein C1H69_15095 [Halomonas endophytica]